MTALITRASSINRALDQIGDKWCLLIIQEVFWGINTFSGMLGATGVSRGVLADRLRWLQQIDCLRKSKPTEQRRRPDYHLTRKSVDLYHTALMAVSWERRHFRAPALDAVQLQHRLCGKLFNPRMSCSACGEVVDGRDADYQPGPGASQDSREKKVRRRSSLSVDAVPSERSVYRNLVNLVGDRWTANVIALAYYRLGRFDEFNRELPVATNILADRLRFLVEQGIFGSRAYQQRPRRFEYYLTEKGWDLFPFFLTLLQWGDKWCDPQGKGSPMTVMHTRCGQRLRGRVVCDKCDQELQAHEVDIRFK